MSNDILVAIQSYVVDGVPLRPYQQVIYERWTAAFTLLCKYKKKSIAAQQLMNQYGIGQAQAYRDLQGSERVFGNARKYTKEALRYMIIEMLMEDIEEYDVRAKMVMDKEEQSSLDLRVWEHCKKLKTEALKAITKAGAIEKDDEFIPDFSDVQAPNLQISLNDSALNLLQGLLQKGSVDLDNLPILELNDIEDAVIETENQ